MRAVFLVCVYLLDMKHTHPDYVTGEPVPVVEPFVNEELQAQSLSWIRFFRWAIALLFVIVVFFTIFHVSEMARYITIGVCCACFIGWAFRPSNRAMRKDRKKYATDKWSIPLRILILFQAHMGIMMVLLMALLSAGDGLSDMSFYGGMLILFGGIGLVYAGKRGREPGQICCDKCSYELAGLTLPCQCPECGIWLLSLDMITDRPRVQSPWFFRIGVPVISMGLAVLVLGTVRPSLFYGPVPRSMLISLAATDRGAFDQLMTRNLNEEEQNKFEDIIINTYEGGGRVPVHGPGDWIAKQGDAGLLSSEQLDRLFSKLDRIRIDADREVKVGDAVELRLGFEDKVFINVSLYPDYFFEGFVIGDDPALFAGSGFLRHWILLKYQDNRLSSRNHDRGSPVYLFVPESSGEVVVRARVVVAYYDAVAQSGATFSWSDQGQPMFTPQPAWMKVIDLEHTMIVEP